MSAIDEKYQQMGGEAFLGAPQGPEIGTADGMGTVRHYAAGSIWWSPATGAHAVYGRILARYSELGAETFLGYPTTDELATGDGAGRVGFFQNGTVYWSAATDAHEVYGAILGLWQSLGAEASSLGYPRTGELASSDGVGRHQEFQGGTIAWHPSTGAQVVGVSGDPLTALLQAFAGNPAPAPWKGFTRQEVAGRLAQLAADADLVDQGNLNLCGPAAFYRAWIRRDPLAFVRFAVELFDTGRSSINGYEVAPDDDAVLATDYAAELRKSPGLPPAADWMVLGSIRDAENALYDYEGKPDEDVAAMTMPGEIVEWLEASRAYPSIVDEVNTFFTKGLDHATGLAPAPGRQIIVLINTLMLTNGDPSPSLGAVQDYVLSKFPNHYIGLESPIVDLGGSVQFTYWSWGSTPPHTTITVAKELFEDNYYGAITAA